MNLTQQFTAYAPHVTTDGNHERDWPSSGALSPAPPRALLHAFHGEP